MKLPMTISDQLFLVFQAIVALVGFAGTGVASIYCFFLRKKARLTDQERDQIQKDKWEQRTQVQNV